jgi:5-methylcytosine-specific restriction endonuclease McrA
MHRYDLVHVTDSVLLRDLTALVAQDRSTTANLLAHIAEVDARRLYAPAGYSSMHAYCVEELRLSEDAAFRRIRAARAARQFPALFEEVAEGRVHLAAVSLLAPHLTTENVEQLIQAATNRKKAEIEFWLAERFPGPEVRAVIRPIADRSAAATPGAEELVLERVGEETGSKAPQLVLGRVGRIVSAEDASPIQEPVSPPEPRFLIQLTVSKSTHDKLRYAQSLLSHAVSRRDVAQVLDRALDALIADLEKRKFGASRGCNRPRAARQRRSERSRYIPAPFRRAVWERDHGKCTFVNANGARCNTREYLEFDHVDPLARGGKTTIDGLRLRCRAHNQYEAERTFGAAFMAQKREEARARTQSQERIRDVVAGLRSLGCRAAEARRAAEHSESLRGAPLEDRMRAALAFLGSSARRRTIVGTVASG